jgi:hypothetical protein
MELGISSTTVQQLGYILSRRTDRRISHKICRWKLGLPDDPWRWPHGACISTGHSDGYVDQVYSGQFYKTRVVDRNDVIPPAALRKLAWI